MSRPFDHTLKFLMETWPDDWLRLLGIPCTGNVEHIETELRTMSVQADRLFRVSGPDKLIAHIEVQSTPDPGLSDRIFLYNTLTYHREGVPVLSHVILLRRKADGPSMTGVLRRHDPRGNCYLQFEYGVTRVWEIPVERILAGGPGIWPMAPLAADAEPVIADVVHDRMRRVASAVPVDRQGEFWAATFILTGLLDHPETGATLLRGVRTMKDSVTYQEILAEGLGNVSTWEDLLRTSGQVSATQPPLE